MVSGNAAELGPPDDAATAGLLAVYVVGTTVDARPGTSIDFHRSAATVIPTLPRDGRGAGSDVARDAGTPR